MYAVFASGISIIGTFPAQVETYQPTNTSYATRIEKQKVILLQSVRLSMSAQKALSTRIEKVKPSIAGSLSVQGFKNKLLLPSRVELGMNHVPALDQGPHGSCVTFAVAGLLDSLIGRADYISELCSLTLGNYLAKNKYNYPSGWNGSSAVIVLNQIFNYGIVPLALEKSVSCGGLASYPVSDYWQEGGSTTPKEYAAISKSIKGRYEWHELLSSESAFIESRYKPSQMLQDVKKALKKGTRITFATLLDVERGNNGALGKYRVRHGIDTWMLTPAIEEDIKYRAMHAAHQMIITGYDDNAIVKDSNGYKNKGLLTLRNSWGHFAGDRGNFYMTYDHFKAMVFDAHIIKEKH